MLVAGHEIEIVSATDAIYNGFDNCLTYEIDEVRERKTGNQSTLIYDFERSLQGPVLSMMTRGFRVDINEREKAVLATQARKADTERILSALVNAAQGRYNTKFSNSGKQLQELFYATMKLPPIEKRQDGELKRPMDRETLERLRNSNKWAEPIINGILLNRDLSKTLQVLETGISVNWRWHCSYNIGGTTTGRFSSSKSPFGDGNNFQNITEELRRIFIPDPGYKLYGIDKAQSEARDVGWFCGLVFGDWSYLDACESGDLHTYVTRLLYPDWHWTGDLKRDREIAERRFYRLFTYRDASKRLGHGSNYLGQPRELSRQIRIPLPLVEEFQERYFAAFPCIQKMHQWVASVIQTERYLVNSFGRRRDFFDPPNLPDTLKAAVAYLFQSATGDALNLGMFRLWKKMDLQESRIQLLSQLHDAVYFQAPIPKDDNEEQEMLREAVALVQVTQCDPVSGRSMTIPGEVVGGFNWAHRWRLLEDGSKEDWNPLGLTGIRIAS